MTLAEAEVHVGDKVVYRAVPGSQRPEEGVITSVNSRYVFVRYGADVGSKATDPRDISLLAP